jgi:AcrR family transcriptional regulator
VTNRERPQLDREVIFAWRRRSAALALGEACIEKGYRAATINDVVARARTSRGTVYELFKNKEEIFFFLLDSSEAELSARVEDACGSAGEDRAGRLEAGLAAVLGWVAEEPVRAWAVFVESICATPDSLRRHTDAISRFANLLGEVVPRDVPRPRSFEESVVGGVASLISGRIRAGEAAQVPALLGELMMLLRGPFLSVGPGARAAV